MLTTIAPVQIALGTLDLDRLTDWIGLPLAFALIGLLILLDVRQLDPDPQDGNGVIGSRRNSLRIAAAVAAAFLIVIALRVHWLVGS
jgi:hypothetical protein